MNPVVATVGPLPATNVAYVAASQTLGAAGNLTLTANAAAIVAVGQACQITLTSGGNDSGITFTIAGTNATGLPQSETITGGNGGLVTSTNLYQSVTRIAASGPVATTVSAGVNGVGSSRIVNPDTAQNPFNLGIGCVVTGTVNFTVQHTFDDIFTTNTLTWFSNTGITGKTGNTDGNYAFAVRGTRVLLNSGSGSVVMTVIQSTHY